jgi:hypothetical protein
MLKQLGLREDKDGMRKISERIAKDQCLSVCKQHCTGVFPYTQVNCEVFHFEEG